MTGAKNDNMDERPICVDLYCGLGGWAEGFLANNFRVIGYDIEAHDYGTGGYPGELRIKDVLDITAEEIRELNPRVIVASPPCQEPSYRAMPWSRAKALNVKPPSNFLCLFYACFKLAKDVGVPVIVENVRGAVPWVGPAAWNFGAYYLWGDIPALMPLTMKRGQKVPGFRFDGSGKSFQSESVKVAGLNWSGHGQPGYKPKGFNVTAAQNYRQQNEGLKQGGDWFGPGENCSISRRTGSKSDSRKAASAMIAKIPFPLASHIARCFA